MAEPIDLAQAYEIAFATPAGIAVLRDLLEVSGFLSIYPGGADAQTLAYHNGTRAVFAQVYAILMSTERGREAMAEAFRPVATRSDE